MRAHKGPADTGLRSLPGCVEEDLRQFARLGEHRPVAGVHLDQPPVVAGQQLGYLVAEFVSGEQALDVRRREFAKWSCQHGGLGERGAWVRRRATHDPCDLLIAEAVTVEAGCGHERPKSSVLGDRCLHHRTTVRPGGDERLAIGRNAGIDEDHVSQPVTDPLRSLTDRDARVAVAHQDNVVQILAFDLAHYVSDVGLLPSRHTPLFGKTGQRQRVSSVASCAQIRHHLVPRPRPEPRASNEHEICHGCTVTEQPDNRALKYFDTRPSRSADDGRHPGRGAMAWRAASAAAGDRPVGVPHRPGVGHQCGPPRGHPLLPGDRRLPGGRAGDRGRRPWTWPWGTTDPGYGILGMRERVALLHGEFSRRTAPRRRFPGRGPAAPAGGSPMTVRVILADDQPLVRAALQMVITDAPDIEVVGEAGTGTEAVELTEGLRPDVVVMDIRMPGMDGIKATRLITAGPSRARVIVLTTFDDDDYVYGALRAGASGFLVKDMALDDILAAIRVVAAGDALIAPSVTRRLIAEFAGHPGPVPSRRMADGITEREREVLTLVGRGMSNTEIADHLVISVATVKTYVTRLLAKLDARDRVQLVIIAYETGLVATPR